MPRRRKRHLKKTLMFWLWFYHVVLDPHANRSMCSSARPGCPTTFYCGHGILLSILIPSSKFVNLACTFTQGVRLRVPKCNGHVRQHGCRHPTRQRGQELALHPRARHSSRVLCRRSRGQHRSHPGGVLAFVTITSHTTKRFPPLRSTGQRTTVTIHPPCHPPCTPELVER